MVKGGGGRGGKRGEEREGERERERKGEERTSRQKRRLDGDISELTGMKLSDIM